MENRGGVQRHGRIQLENVKPARVLRNVLSWSSSNELSSANEIVYLLLSPIPAELYWPSQPFHSMKMNESFVYDVSFVISADALPTNLRKCPQFSHDPQIPFPQMRGVAWNSVLMGRPFHGGLNFIAEFPNPKYLTVLHSHVRITVRSRIHSLTDPAERINANGTFAISI